MPFSGSGSFAPYTPGNPVVSGAVISATDHNNTIADIASGLSNTVTRDGQSPPTANLPMSNFKLTGLAAGTVAGDSARFEQLPSSSNILAVASGGTGLGTGENLALSGEVKMWPTGTAPAGHLLCNGAAVSRTTYASLFAVVSTVFGVGDGSTTFNVPDFRDRMPIGAGTTYSANSSGGSANAVVVDHTHTMSVSNPAHDHTMGGVYALFGNTGGGSAVLTQSSNSSTGSTTTSVSVAAANTGVSGTNANLPPYLAIYFIIKT